MTDKDAISEAKQHWPKIDWELACPVLPTEKSPIDNASWLVLSKGKYIALVDGGPGPQLFKLQNI
jgi:hypothetical protein